MRIVDPQTATLTNIEVLAFFTANPPRRPPNPPLNSTNWVPNPDLRDHNTVVKEIHNYVDRISPHLLNYPRYTDSTPPPQEQQHQQEEQEGQEEEEQQQDAPPERALPYIQPAEPTPLDNALRTLVQELEPYRLTKGEILMLINLGVGLKSPNPLPEDGGVAETVEQEEEQQQEEEEDELDFTTRAIINSAIEEQEERFSDEDVLAIVTIMRNTLGKQEG